MKLIQLAFNVHERKMQDLPDTKQSRYVTNTYTLFKEIMT